MAGLPISIGSVGVRIVPDMRGFLEEINAYTKRIGDIHIGVDVDAGESLAELAGVNEMVDHLSGQTAHIGVDVDSGVADAQLALSGMTKDLSGMPSLAGLAGGGLAHLGLMAAGVVLAAGPLAAALAPAIAGIGAAAVSGAGALGVLGLAVSGVSKAISAFRTEQLNPTAQNLTALQAAMKGLTPAARGFVTFVGSKLLPVFTRLQHAAANGLLPGLTRGLKAMMPLVKPLTGFIGDLAHTMGNLAAQAGKALNDKFWRGFFSFLDSIAGPTLRTFAKIIGNVAVGLATMFEAMGPLTKQLGAALLSISQSFVAWTRSKAFTHFIAYITKNGPQVGRTLVDLAKIALRLVIAFAPIAPVVLKIVDAVTRLLNKISNTHVITEAISAFRRFGGAVASAAGHVASAAGSIGRFMQQMYDKIRSAWRHVVSFLQGIPGKIKHAFGDAGKILAGIGKAIIQGLWDGMKSVWHHVAGWLGSLGGAIKSLKGPIDKDRVLLHPEGIAIIQGLADGMKSAWPTVTAILTAAGKSVPTSLAAGVKAAQGVLDQQIAALRSKMTALRQGIFSGLTGGANLSNFTPLGNIVDPVTGKKVPHSAPGGQVAGFLGGYADEVQKMVREMKKAHKIGIPDAIIDQIANLGPTPQAFALLHDLDHSTPGEVRTIRHGELAINSAAHHFARGQIKEHYGTKLAQLDVTNDRLQKIHNELKLIKQGLGHRPHVDLTTKARGRA